MTMVMWFMIVLEVELPSGQLDHQLDRLPLMCMAEM
jgi:hypothetical protein